MNEMYYNQQGFSTFELLIAFSLLILSITAVIMVAFGNQSNAIDTELAQNGLSIAAETIEEITLLMQNNFDAISTEPIPIAYSSSFDTQIKVSDISECVKRVESVTLWNRGLRKLGSTLRTVIVDTNVSEALEGDCATSESAENWDNPHILASHNISESGTTALDELGKSVYVTANPGNSADEAEFFIFKYDETENTLAQIGSLDLGTDGSNFPQEKFGLYDVDVIPNYAFVASASRTGQFKVIDTSNPANPVLKWSILLPGVNVTTGSFPEARSIYYYDDKIYIGTHETAGPEFHIFDVSRDLDVYPPLHLASMELTHNVHDIVVRDTYAYLATSDNNHELMIINVSNPKKLTHPDTSNLGFNASGTHDSTAVFVTGDKVYIGRKRNSKTNLDDFIILKREIVLDSSSISDGRLGGVSDIGLVNNTYIAGIRVSGDLAFLAINKPSLGLLIFNITDPTDIFLPASCSTFDSLGNTTKIDIDSNNEYIFLSNFDEDDVHVVANKNNSCNT